jgi:hypothetical protein
MTQLMMKAMSNRSATLERSRVICLRGADGGWDIAAVIRVAVAT